MAVTVRRQVMQRLGRLLPMLIIGLLFLAPAAIWLVKREQPAIDQIRVPGRILDVTELPTQETGAADRFTIRLRDGQVIVFETGPTAMPLQRNDDVVVERVTSADGSIGYRLEGQ